MRPVPENKARADLLDFLVDGQTLREEVSLKPGQPSGQIRIRDVLPNAEAIKPRNGVHPIFHVPRRRPSRTRALRRERAFWVCEGNLASVVLVHDDKVAAAVAPDAQEARLAVRLLAQFDRFLRVVDRFAIDLLDYVARPQTGFGRR